MFSVAKLSNCALEFAINGKVEIPFNDCKIFLEKDNILIDKNGEQTKYTFLSEIKDESIGYIISLVYAVGKKLVHYAHTLPNDVLLTVSEKDAAYGIMICMYFEDVIKANQLNWC